MADDDVFIKIPEAQKVLADVQQLTSKVDRASELYEYLYELKKEEDEEFELWRVQIEDIQHKLDAVERLLPNLLQEPK